MLQVGGLFIPTEKGKSVGRKKKRKSFWGRQRRLKPGFVVSVFARSSGFCTVVGNGTGTSGRFTISGGPDKRFTGREVAAERMGGKPVNRGITAGGIVWIDGGVAGAGTLKPREILRRRC